MDGCGVYLLGLGLDEWAECARSRTRSERGRTDLALLTSDTLLGRLIEPCSDSSGPLLVEMLERNNCGREITRNKGEGRSQQSVKEINQCVSLSQTTSDIQTALPDHTEESRLTVVVLDHFWLLNGIGNIVSADGQPTRHSTPPTDCV
jgi:hypothetical protein